MTYIADELLKTLKDSRQQKGLSQREVGEKAGLPQSHISRIEKGDVDLTLSSFMSLARALDMEVTLVPRKALPAVKALTVPNDFWRIKPRTVRTRADYQDTFPKFRADEDRFSLFKEPSSAYSLDNDADAAEAEPDEEEIE